MAIQNPRKRVTGNTQHLCRRGQLLETFVFQELWRQASWHDVRMSFHHFRDKDGKEVDIVIERGTAGLAGVEVKASGTVRPADFRGLRKLQGALGDRFAGGVVLYDGEAIVPFGERLHAVPVRRLVRGCRVAMDGNGRHPSFQLEG